MGRNDKYKKQRQGDCMSPARSFHRLAAAVLAGFAASCIAASAAWAQQAAGEYVPRLGQSGKDVIWLPSPDATVNRMLRMAEVTSRDYLVDLGSGDGKIPIAAARGPGARALGLEYNPDLVDVSRRRAREAGVQDKVEFRQADIFTADFSNATVVTMYLLPELNLKLRPILFRMKPGTRISSNSFDMQTWMPDEISHVGTARSFLWIIPAHVAGDWTVSYGAGKKTASTALTLRQRFQKVEGEAQFEGFKASLQDVRLRGSAISFATRDANGDELHFAGKIDGNRMVGATTSARHGRARFRAERSIAPAPFEEAIGTEQEKIDAVRALGAN
jgi:hypothetical protein